MDSTDISLLDAVTSGKEHRYLNTRTAACFGMFSVIFFSVCWILGIIIDGDWVWNEDVICRLGISESRFVANMYLVSCVTTGIGLMACGFGIFRESPRLLEKFAFFSCIIFGFSMIGLGLIDMTHTDEHRVFSTAIMLFGIVTMTADTIEDFIQHKYLIASLTFLFGLLIVGILLNDPDSVQTIAVAGMLVWLFSRCVMKVWNDKKI